MRERSIQIADMRPGRIAGLGREFYLDPPSTRIRVVRFHRFYRRLTAPFIVFSELGSDGAELDVVAITNGDRLNEMLDALRAVGPEKIDPTPVEE